MGELLYPWSCGSELRKGFFLFLFLSFESLSNCSPEASLVAQTVENLPAMRETWAQSLDQKESLEKEIATQYSCLENSMDRGAWSMGSQRVRTLLSC